MACGGGGSFVAGLLLPPPRDPNKFDRIFTDCGVAFLKGTPSPLAEEAPPFTGLGCTRGGGGRGGGTFRCDCGTSKGESSQLVVGVYRWEFPGGGGAGAGLDGVGRCIWNGGLGVDELEMEKLGVLLGIEVIP